jgi:hypothetical protein
MYYVITANGYLKFPMFTDAWLHVVLELPCFAKIVGPDGEWVVNPPRSN